MTTSPPPPPSSATSKVFLAVAVTLGVLATILAFAFINGAAGGTNSGPKITIVVARHDLDANTVIDPNRDLKTMDIPTRFGALRAASLDPEALATYKGQRVNRYVQGDQPVMLGDLGGVGSLELEAPFFALTLPAETGMIIPGDFVKIIITKANTVSEGAGSPRMAGGLPFDATIIGKDAGFKVLAVGGYLFKTRQQVLTADQYGAASNAAKSVTLQVTEPQAKEIMGALGSLSTTNKAILLLCPGPNTKPPAVEGAPVPVPATATRP
ncbi:MAG TPA: hypothetical protein VHM90_09870 [Phycisphaerae bacterium]|nr:hypothetical protein [Phycisphaerae bacterium]